MPIGANPMARVTNSASAGPADQQNLTYDKLKSKYYEFANPRAKIELDGKEFAGENGDMIVNDIHIELVSGFEASIATFRIYHVYDAESGEFRYDEISKQIVLGKSVVISLGYINKLEKVFVGFIAGVDFCYEGEGHLPYIEVSAMDIKGIMMGGSYASQCTTDHYSGAVKEIFNRTAYQNLKSGGGYIDCRVDETADKKTGGDKNKVSDYTVEMVSESDYDFVVKAAKKFNFEFFVDRGRIYFRKAKSNTTTLMTIGSGKGLRKFNVGYSLTGLVATVEARAMDAGQGKIITAKEKYPEAGKSISTGNQAKKLLGDGTKVYIDPTIKSQTQAEARAAALKEQMSYRLGNLEGTCVGLPDLVPGRFIKLSGLGGPTENRFYLTEVVHDFDDQRGFETRITGCANQVGGMDL
jgi:hypothetical protein